MLFFYFKGKYICLFKTLVSINSTNIAPWTCIWVYTSRFIFENVNTFYSYLDAFDMLRGKNYISLYSSINKNKNVQIKSGDSIFVKKRLNYFFGCY